MFWGRSSLLCRARRAVLFAAVAVFFSTAPPATAADPFYEKLLREGILEAERGDWERTTKLLRLACFGFLDEPEHLGRCLTLLATAQAEGGDSDAFLLTFRRISEIEERFSAYTRSGLTSAERRAFEDRLVELAPRERIEGSPFGRWLAEPEPVTSPLPSGEPPEAAEAIPPAPPENGAAPLEDETPPSVLPPAPLDEVTAALARARAIGPRVTRDELLLELDALRPVADAHPDIRELQHLAAELAYRLRLWEESRRYFERGGAIEMNQPALLFYFAVALYESKEVDRAAEVLRKCLPRLKKNAFIEEYAAKILAAAN